MKQPKQPGFFRITDPRNNRVLFVPVASTAFEIFVEGGRLNVVGPSLYVPLNIDEIIVESVAADSVEDSILDLLNGIRSYLLKEVVIEESSEATTE